jgi:hypothetical protein
MVQYMNNKEIQYYEKDCIERYGSKTCLLIQYNDKYEIRLLDTIPNKMLEKYMILKDSFSELIPKLLSHKYTVVLIEKVENKREITAVHLPVQSHLTIPPIIQ